METMMMIDSRPRFLRTVLLVDAATCVATGLLMTAGSAALAPLTQLPADLLFYAGLSLFPVAAFIAFVATRKELPPAGVWLVIAGNAAWVAGSLWLLLGGTLSPSLIGYAFLAAQAAAVAVLAELEYVGLRRLSSSAA
jgi:hypothetical protein